MRTLFAPFVSALLLVPCRAEVVAIPHPGVAVPLNKTVVWSPVFQATWDAFVARCKGPLLRTEPPNELMDKLDSFRFDAKSTLPEGRWKVWAGPATKAFLDHVNEGATAITKEKPGPFRLERESPDNIAAFGLLDRQVEFTKALYRSGKKPMDFITSSGAASSQFFGVAGGLSAGFDESIRVLSYEPDKKSHALELMCKEEGETVILYLPEVSGDFATACDAVRKWKADFKADKQLAGTIRDPHLHRNDSLRVPYVSFDVMSDFPDLTTSLRFHRDEPEPWKIYRVQQLTRFDLYEKGARVRVETSLEAEPFGDPPPPPPTVPRQFIYDRPFFVFLWRDKAEWPYFGAWIGDASALKPFQ